MRGNLRQALRQLAQRDVDRTVQVSGAELIHLAHVDQAWRGRARVAQQLVQCGGREAAHRGPGRGGQGCRVAGLGDRRRVAAHRAVGPARDAELVETHLERVVGQQPSGERLAHAGDQLDRFGRLQRAQHAGQYAEDPGLRAIGHPALGCLREHAPVARAPAGHVELQRHALTRPHAHQAVIEVHRRNLAARGHREDELERSAAL